MAQVTSRLYPTAAAARALASIKGGGDQPTQNTVDVALNSAINSGLFSTTASMTGLSAQDIQMAMNTLQAHGYTVSLSGTTLTMNW